MKTATRKLIWNCHDVSRGREDRKVKVGDATVEATLDSHVVVLILDEAQRNTQTIDLTSLDMAAPDEIFIPGRQVEVTYRLVPLADDSAAD